MSINRILTLLTLCALTIGTACSFGVMPEWTRSGRPSVSVSLAAIDPDGSGSASRAIAQGGGYLYLRTLGGPAGASGSFYGPYEIASGGSVTITDIPAGTFSRIFAVYSASAVNTATKYSILGGSYTFGEFMSVPDDIMNGFLDGMGTKGESGDGEDMANAFGGTGSYGVTGSVTLTAGTTTSLSLTLIPITSSSTSIPLYESNVFTFSSGAPVKCFYRLEGIQVSLPVTAGSLVCTMTADSATAGSLDNAVFYDGKGKAVGATKSGSSLTGGYTWSIDATTVNVLATSTGYVELYLYIAYSGTISARFMNTAPPNVYVAVEGEANASWQGRKVLLGIYDATAVANVKAGRSLLKQVPVAMGILTLDPATGDGSMTLQSQSIKAGATYYASAQIDEKGTYASLSGFAGVDLATLIPYKGDLVTEGDADLMASGVYGLNAFAAGSAVNLTAAGFSTCNDNVYFASSAGGGTGLSPSSPATFANAMSLAAANSPAQIYVMDDISGLSTQTVSTQVTIQSYGSAPRTIKPTSYLSSMPFFQINTTASLEFNNITIDCSGLTGAMQSLLYTATGAGADQARLALGSDATLIGCSGGNVANGGGIYLSNGSILEMWGCTVKNCYSSSSGGAVYVGGAAGYTTLATIGPACLFTNNISGSGSAIFIGSYGTAYIWDSTFSGNTNNVAGNAPICVGADATAYAKGLSFTGNTNGATYVTNAGGTWNIMP